MSHPFRLRSIAAGLALTAILSGTALAQTPAPAATPAAEPAKAEPDWTFTSNVGLYSQYVFRGITQTNEKPAVQGGFDLVAQERLLRRHVGVEHQLDLRLRSGASASMEWDIYGGYKGTPAGRLRLRPRRPLLLLPGQRTRPAIAKPNTTELYGALSWKWLSLKYSWSANNKTFGIPDSRGSSYLDLTASYDVVDEGERRDRQGHR